MSWFSKKSSAEKGKKKQIQSLKSYHGKQYKVEQMAGNSFRIRFRTRIGELTLVLSLANNFPESAPQLRTDSKFRHPWLDTNGNIVGCQALSRWNSNSDLGRTVLQCVQQFVAAPPTMQVQQQQQQQQPPPSYEQHVQHQHQQRSQPRLQKKQISSLDMSSITLSIPQSIPQLNAKSEEELAEMCDNDELLQDFAFDVASTLREMKQQSQKEILRIARQNMSAKSNIEHTEIECRELEAEIASSLQLYSKLELRQQKVMKKFSKERINQEIDEELQKLEGECEAIQDTFNEKNMAPVTFCKKYRTVRKNWHSLAIKKEKFNTLY